MPVPPTSAPGTLETSPELLRVLLVEDDDGDALLVEDLLELAGAPVDLRRASRLGEALQGEARFADCVLLDLDLPDSTGLTGLLELRESADAPAILVLTGLDDTLRGIEAVAAGAQDYLIKGKVDGDVLWRAIRYAVERRRAEQAQSQLQAARIHAQENARLERGLLPTPLVSDPRLALAAHYRPGRRRALLGGDFYDAVEARDGVVHAIIGDVCGHGPDEAALGVFLRIAWRTLVMAATPPETLLNTLQEVLVAERHDTSVFTTLCMVSIDPDRRRAVLRVAGHPLPVVLVGSAATPVTPERGGPPLGVIADATWPAREIALPEGFGLLLYTDGLIEGRVGAGPARLGESGLVAMAVAALLEHGGRPGALVRSLVEQAEALNGGALLDDVAVLLVSEVG
ncbi:MAG TPA: SpoIIE family protein phosphatase [Solirubrobacteraceae bacterium]|nr:SpoIIE family protein phosphatase [Solirubrobacteraceae bacterium]